MDDGIRHAVLAAVGAEFVARWDAVVSSPDLHFETTESQGRDGVLAIGAQAFEPGPAA